MADESSTGPMRLRTSGVGVVGGGVLLAVAAVVVPFWLAATLVIVSGGIWMVVGEGTDAFQGSVGILAVGVIGLLEALPGIGLGLDPVAFAALAITLGCFDVIAGLVLGRFSNGIDGS
ncbi:hypothetical protein [Halobiforma nitratireducens]|uniref:DUF5518 domain-containing protein n=1 Tax=Halobiforma nitratireducens JCM 10879 TaxID=1227454 RepID=M0MG04_9EURY|nr:hypothetical protein [Halobiforma nitratireducens]EMA44636.1 hypothetical protein C446_02752 [Halobiforma nitratireducens JCM 10879]